MPRYDYNCKNCDNTEEIHHSMTDETKYSCSKCGKEMQKMISGGSSFIFKGAGFHVNDYPKDFENV